MNKETREALDLFVEKADELMASEFVKYWQDQGKTGFSISGDQLDTGGKWRVRTERYGPTETEIKAFAVTFRFFVRDYDRISFRSLAKLCCDKSLSERWRREVKKVQREVNEFLDKWHLPISVGDLPNPSARDIMEVFIFGDIIHADPKLRPSFKKWKGSGLFPAFESEFVSLMTRILLDMEVPPKSCTT